MSLKVMSAVWERADVSQTALLVLLALADRADDDGVCWPSVAGLAQRARVSERTAQRVLSDLERGGWITREVRPGRPTLYRITLRPPAPVDTPDSMTPRQSDAPTSRAVGVTDSVTEGVTPSVGGVVTDSVTRTVMNPQSTVKGTARERARGTRIPDPFPITPEMVAWARVNAPDLDHRAVTEAFIDHWRAQPGAKGTKADWPATWRNWLRREAIYQHRGRSPAAKPTTDDRVRDGLRLAQELRNRGEQTYPQIGA